MDTFCLMALWHATFMNLLVDFNILERAIGRDSRSNTLLDSDLAYTAQWANSSAARRCILHAYALRDSLSNIRVDTEPAIHVPHCLFFSWHCKLLVSSQFLNSGSHKAFSRT